MPCFAVAAAVSALAQAPLNLIVSANDAKYFRVRGADIFDAQAGSDTVSLLDCATMPPRVTATINVHHSLFGPPQAVALTPDGKTAFVSAPNRLEAGATAPVAENFIQVVSLIDGKVGRIPLGSHPQGVAINRTGTLVLVATAGGTVAVLGLTDNGWRLRQEENVSEHRLSSVAFGPDGRSALVGLRDDQGLAVLEVTDTGIRDSGERIATGVAPYTIDTAGRWAVVANVGLAGLKNPGRLAADCDSITLVDMARRPFRAVQHISTPATPEAAALSPDGRWVAVQAMAGSNLPASNASRQERGRLVLFENRMGVLHQTADISGGEASQGLVFTADGRHLLVQFNVERQIAIYAVDEGQLRDTTERVSIPGGPASIRAVPR
jgi:DNA-binding beta-propeller fold protein YncE